MRLDGFGLFVDDMAKMIRFYKDVLGFEIKEEDLPECDLFFYDLEYAGTNKEDCGEPSFPFYTYCR